MAKRIEPTIICQGCGKPFPRTVHPSGNLESLARFRQRRFCSLKCSGVVTATERAPKF